MRNALKPLQALRERGARSPKTIQNFGVCNQFEDVRYVKLEFIITSHHITSHLHGEKGNIVFACHADGLL